MVNTNTSIWCTDIDGVLIDSRELVKESYRSIGIEMPTEAWGHPWKQWLPAFVGSYEDAEKLHAKKTTMYVDVLRSGAVRNNALPFAMIARALERDPISTVYYVTGAAEETAIAILSELGLDHSNLVASSIATTPRTDILKKLSSYGVYVDDRIEGQVPAQDAGWKFIWAKQDWQWNQ